MVFYGYMGMVIFLVFQIKVKDWMQSIKAQRYSMTNHWFV